MLKGVIDTGSGTVNRVTSPATPGSYMVQARTQSLRDADGDGIENKFDTCAWAANTDDPYSTNGIDIDMLDPVCDPAPGAKNDDQDGDGYLNAQDYCPLVANSLPGGETDSENTVPYNTGAPDGGPRQDQIGDDCDGVVHTGPPGPGYNPSGLGNPTVSDGLYFNAIHVDSVTITGGGVVDDDEDGWGSDTDTDDWDHYNPGQMTHTPMDSAGIFVPPTTDTDEDGFSNLDEWYMGVDPGNHCPLFPGQHDAWPPDFDMNRVINVIDVFDLQ
ncbi:unnamed protein product, partial [marine sediment metagenome]